MRVRGPGIPDQPRGLPVAVPALAKGHERPGIEPGRVAVLIGGQQLLERAVIVLSEQASGEDVPYPLIVVRVQLKHVAVVGDSAVDVAKLQERARETGPGPHIGACFEKAPEVTGIPLEAPRCTGSMLPISTGWAVKESGSHPTLRWREKDSNPRSPVRGTMLFEPAPVRPS